MDRKEYYLSPDFQDQQISDSDSGIYTDKESTSQDLGGIFSNKFSNIDMLYCSEHGATEIHTATRYGKRFVLKGLRKEYREDPVYNMCMAKEFEIGMTLDHPNIRRTIGIETVDGLGKRIILEYIDGVTLAEKLSTGHISSEEATSVARQAADALRYLHGKQICHRDLKPENILIPYLGDTIKIIDFNLSDSDDYIILKNPAGSKRYMAPELTSPDSRPTPETDYYSLGVLIGDIAKASNNHLLSVASSRFMAADPKRRIEGLSILEKDPHLHETTSLPYRIISSKTITYILSAICLILSVFITLHYID
ncbi:MAG: protein kinase [Muribaculaceae bacterium]|nr:protein kinase [Muribaculaceae bacterium]